MSIFRIKKERNYTCMSNHHLRNHTISLKAIGLLSVILSMPDNYKVTIKGLAYSVKDGIASVRSSVNELIDAGYIVRKQSRSNNGKFCEYEYDVYENPTNAEKSPVTIGLTDFVPEMKVVETGLDTEGFDTAEYIGEENFENDDEFFFGEDHPAECSCEKNTENFSELNDKVDKLAEVVASFVQTQDEINRELITSNSRILSELTPYHQNSTSGNSTSENCTHINTNKINTDNINTTVHNNHIYQSNNTYNNGMDRIDGYSDNMPDLALYEKYKELIKNNIDYDDFTISLSPTQLEKVDEMVDIMAETVTFNTSPISINGSLIPSEVVKSRLLKVNYSDIEYVLFCLDRTTSKIYNIRKYLIATIYNARSTQSNYYSAEVNHDMYGA